MSNFVRAFTSGAPTNGILPSAAVETIDSQLEKACNGDDGSTHVGTLVFNGGGGVTAAHLTNRTYNDAAVASTETVTCNCAEYSQFDLDLNGGSGAYTVTLSFSNLREGDTIYVLATATNHVTNPLTLTWAGTGITHRFPSGDDDFVYASDTIERVMWKGKVRSTTEIWWEALRY